MCPVLIAQGGNALLIGDNDSGAEKNNMASVCNLQNFRTMFWFYVSLRAKPPPSFVSVQARWFSYN